MSPSIICRCCGDDATAPGVEVFRFVFQRPLHSATNRERAVNNAGGWAYRKARDGWARDVQIAVMAKRAPAAHRPRRVFLTRLLTGRQQLMDPDNLAAAFKPVQDALIVARLIIDDGPRHARIHYGQRREAAPSLGGIEIVVEEATP